MHRSLGSRAWKQGNKAVALPAGRYISRLPKGEPEEVPSGLPRPTRVYARLPVSQQGSIHVHCAKARCLEHEQAFFKESI